MSRSVFLTDSENAIPTKLPANASFDYKEAVTTALIAKGATLRTAEVAVLDLRYLVNVGYHNKKSPSFVADTLLEKMQSMYKHPDGSWHY